MRMGLIYFINIILFPTIVVVSLRSNRRGILAILLGILSLNNAVLFFSPNYLYLRDLELEEATAEFYFRDIPLDEGDSLIVRIYPKDSKIYSGEYEIQYGYESHMQLKLEIRPEADGTFIIEELGRPSKTAKWRIDRYGELSKID